MKIVWNQKLGQPQCPYLQRWALEFKRFTLRLHHWISSDDQRNYHDHPWWFLTIVLRGGYTDISPEGRQRMTAGSIAFRRAEHQHTVEVDPGGCWTLLLTGPEARVWGFWVKGRFRKRNKYFYMFGHHPCETQK